jgi:hypothetical protein
VTKNFTLGLIAVLVLWTAFWIGAYLFDKPATSGQFGDTFGALNALFSGLAFAFLIASIDLQRRELRLQREELQMQRQEMADSRAVLALQARAQTLQVDAAIAQILVTALRTKADGIRIHGTAAGSTHVRQEYVDKINEISVEMQVISVNLQKKKIAAFTPET